MLKVITYNLEATYSSKMITFYSFGVIIYNIDDLISKYRGTSHGEITEMVSYKTWCIYFMLVLNKVEL